MLPIAASIIITRSLVVLSRNSWMLVWIALELNTLSFCRLLITKVPQQKKIAEASIKYFIIQSTASAIIIIYLSVPGTIKRTDLLFIAGTAAILIKLASAPFHRWFLEIVPKVRLKTRTLLITWQKLAPIYLLIFIIKTVVLVRILARGILGSIRQITKNKLMEVIALSSVFNLSWIILASMLRRQRLFIFIRIYWTVLLIVIIIFIKHKIPERSNNLTKNINPWVVTVLIAGLAGLPPTLGFYAKIQVILQALKSSIKEIATLLLVIRATNFYIYLRIVSPRAIFSPSQSQKNKEKPNKIITLALMLNLLPILVIIL